MSHIFKLVEREERVTQKSRPDSNYLESGDKSFEVPLDERLRNVKPFADSSQSRVFAFLSHASRHDQPGQGEHMTRKLCI
jgi:hypothetical protein